MKLYRYYKWCSNETLVDYDGISYVKINAEEFEVVKETKCGYWIKVNLKPKWTSKTSKKRFAYPTKKEALENFIRRTQRNISINHYNIDFAQLALKEAEKLMNEF